MPRIVPVASFAEIEAELLERTRALVWCTVATLDTQDRPRSRILHPIWEAGGIGSILTWRNTLKGRHLAHSPYVSLAYAQDVWRPVFVECTAAWEDDPKEKARIWRLFVSTPPPLGYDPAPTFGTPGHRDLGLLRLTPYRVTLADSAAVHRVWRRRDPMVQRA